MKVRAIVSLQPSLVDSLVVVDISPVDVSPGAASMKSLSLGDFYFLSFGHVFYPSSTQRQKSLFV